MHYLLLYMYVYIYSTNTPELIEGLLCAGFLRDPGDSAVNLQITPVLVGFTSYLCVFITCVDLGLCVP